MIEIRDSKWKCKTGAAYGANVGPMLFSGGDVTFRAPGGQQWAFSYRGLGSGVEFARLPTSLRLPQIQLPKFVLKSGSLSGTLATADFFGRGGVWMMPGFNGKELADTDFEGPALYMDVSAGVLVSAGCSLILCGGFDIESMVAALMHRKWFIFDIAHALIILVGESAGLVDGAGAGFMMGNMSNKGQVGFSYLDDWLGD
ncbi:hypothetical protein NK8_15560 [Caballeronia sp. NK8]|nr:hypothetical protein NK8_15560 [Caballeronia sp. NK8]